MQIFKKILRNFPGLWYTKYGVELYVKKDTVSRLTNHVPHDILATIIQSESCRKETTMTQNTNAKVNCISCISVSISSDALFVFN